MFEDFAEFLRQNDRASGTVLGYVADLSAFRAWFEADTGEVLDGATVTALDVASYRKYLVEQRLSAATINRRLSAISRWLRWLGNDEASQVRQVQGAARLAPTGLTRREVAAMLRAARRGRHPRRDLALVTLMVETGLRVGEVAALRLGDMTLNGRSGSVRVAAGKGLKTREVPLGRGARAALREWIETRGNGGEWVFISQKGGRLSKNAVQRVIATLATNADLEASAHTLRHTFARNYLEKTGDLVGLARLMGHSNINTTAIYAQPTMDDLAERVESAGIC